MQKWEQGQKKPSGPTLKLLNLVEEKGLDVLVQGRHSVAKEKFLKKFLKTIHYHLDQSNRESFPGSIIAL